MISVISCPFVSPFSRLVDFENGLSCCEITAKEEAGGWIQEAARASKEFTCRPATTFIMTNSFIVFD